MLLQPTQDPEAIPISVDLHAIGDLITAAVADHHGGGSVALFDDAGTLVEQRLTSGAHHMADAEQLVIGVEEIQVAWTNAIR